MREILALPFVDLGFMKCALVGYIAASVGGTAFGVFRMLHCMGLTGDATFHAIPPGVAAGDLGAGLQLGEMTGDGADHEHGRGASRGFRVLRRGVARGYEPRILLTDFTGGGRAARVHPGQQCRPDARALRARVRARHRGPDIAVVASRLPAVAGRRTGGGSLGGPTLATFLKPERRFNVCPYTSPRK